MECCTINVVPVLAPQFSAMQQHGSRPGPPVDAVGGPVLPMLHSLCRFAHSAPLGETSMRKMLIAFLVLPLAQTAAATDPARR
jgi:hypothetical protein